MEQWFLGLRRSEERAVRDEERQALENELRGERQRLRVGLLLSVLGLFLVGTMGVVWESRELPYHFLENALAVVLVALVPLLLYRVHHSQTRMRALVKDLRRGVVVRFDGRLARASLFENENRKAHARMVAEGVLARRRVDSDRQRKEIDQRQGDQVQRQGDLEALDQQTGDRSFVLVGLPKIKAHEAGHPASKLSL